MKRLALLFIALLVMAGCGSGGGSGDTGTPAVANTAAFSTSKMFPMTVTPATSFTLSGSDNAGGSWYGSWQLRGDGQTVYEGQNLIKTTQQIQLGLRGGSSSASTVVSYYRPDYSLYKAVYSGSTSGYAEQTNNFTAPLSFKIGEVLTGPSLTTYINGVTDSQTTTYQISNGGNGNAKVTATVAYTSGLSTATTELVINPTGDLLSLKMVIQYPSQGRTVTLYGTR